MEAIARVGMAVLQALGWAWFGAGAPQGLCTPQKVLAQQQWHYTDPLQACLVLKKDTCYDILFYVAIDPQSYAYANLCLEYTLQAPKGPAAVHTLAEVLYDPTTYRPTGVWGCRGYVHCITLGQGYIAPESGQHTVEVRQYMRCDTLHGVVALGLRAVPRPHQ